MKYVIVAPERKSDTPVFFPVLFSDHLVHQDMVPTGYYAESAGDCYIRYGNAICSGGSETLELKADPERDSAFITSWLLYGESLLIMASEAYAENKPKKVRKKKPLKITGQPLTDKERAKGRSENYWQMSAEDQWAEDKRLGILDWDGN